MVWKWLACNDSRPNKHFHPLPFSSNFKAKEKHKQHVPMKLMDEKQREVSQALIIIYTSHTTSRKKISIKIPPTCNPSIPTSHSTHDILKKIMGKPLGVCRVFLSPQQHIFHRTNIKLQKRTSESEKTHLPLLLQDTEVDAMRAFWSSLCTRCQPH